MTAAANNPQGSQPDAPSPSKPKPRSGFDNWKDGIDRADVKWDAYDCDIQVAINDYNRHLAATPGYFPLDWQLIKAMAWTETGAENREWKVKPMQIGNAGDPGLAALLGGKEGGELIIPPAYRRTLTFGLISTVPSYNIRASIGYLLMRLASFAHKSVADEDAAIHAVTVKAGDSIDKIAKAVGSTPEVMKRLNPTAHVLQPGQSLKYQKASIRKVITGWRTVTTANAGSVYNGTGDSLYSRKLDYALAAIKNRSVTKCN